MPIEATDSERFASIILTALGDKARVKFTGPGSGDGILVVVSERETGLNFGIEISCHTRSDESV